MKTQLDFKSVFCGLVVGVLAMLAIGAGTGTNETGRFQTATAANIALVIDTQTGKVWTKCWTSTAEFTADTNFSETKLPVPKSPETK